MKILRLILGDQLSQSITSLSDIDRENDVVLMVEVSEEASHVKFHKQKIVLVLAGMRHFAAQLADDGIQVDYVKMDDAENLGDFSGELRRALDRHDVDRVVVTEPGAWRVWALMQSWQEELDVEVEIRDDERFFVSRSDFAEWAEDRKSLRMEDFYREMRKRTGWLMQGDEPEGGKWNYDKSNRKSIPDDVEIPERKRFEPDEITLEVIDLVADRFADHFGYLDNFGWAVTRDDALVALDTFVADFLPNFGDYQDAMKRNEDFLFHALLSPYINLGLLSPREVCEAILKAYEAGNVALEATEGFIRQILGWREYMRGVYWLKMPEYPQSNFLQAERPLPALYWTGETDMACMKETIEATRRNAYAHHIQRLMVTGNFALLAGCRPAEVEEWYLVVYADAYDWVELPNVHGMALYADGGLLSTKPYAASGSYINRMSDYCSGCQYAVSKKLGENACPFNYLYWYFMIRNEERLSDNHRMGLTYSTLSKMDPERRESIVEQAEAFLDSLEPYTGG